MENKHISEMNRTEIMGTLTAAMPALDEIKKHWSAAKQCERQIAELNRQKEEYLYPHFHTYTINKNKSSHPNSASFGSMLLYQSRIKLNLSDKFKVLNRGYGWTKNIIGLAVGMLLCQISQVVGAIFIYAFVISAIVYAYRKVYPEHVEKLKREADEMFSTVAEEEEIAARRQAIANIENSSADLIGVIPKAYRNSFSAHSLYEIIDSGRASSWSGATEVFENDKARAAMIENTAAAKQNSEFAIAQAEAAQQRADDAEWAAMQAAEAARQAEINARINANEAEMRAMAYANSRRF
jgi:hypothetical protein